MNGRKMDSSMTTRSKGGQGASASTASALPGDSEDVSSGRRLGRSNSVSSLSSNSESNSATKSHHRTRSSANSSRSTTPTPPVGKEGKQSNPSTPTVGTSKSKEARPTPSSGKKRSLASMLEAGDAPNVPPPKMRKIGKNDGTGVNNKNDYFCWICHREGNVVACEVCPRVYHCKCLGLESNQPKDWVCPECEKILRSECVDTRSKSMSMITVDQLCMLLKFALERMQHPTSQPFQKAVDIAAIPLYGDYIYSPMDLELLGKNIDSKMYGCTEAFLADAKWILHNCIIYNGTHHKLSSSAKLVVKICKHETSEIEICPDCYMNSCLQRNDNWFCEPCRTPHTLVWAKLKGYPFWPAKALREVDGQVDVRFFGAHDRSWVPVSQVFLLSKDIPTAFRNKKAGGFDQAMEELKIHIDKLREEFGSFEYAKFRTPYDLNNVYFHNKMKILENAATKTTKPLTVKSPKAVAQKNTKPCNVIPVQQKASTEVKLADTKSTVTKTASAVKLKYNSIITTRRAAAAKVASLDVSNSPTVQGTNPVVTQIKTEGEKPVLSTSVQVKQEQPTLEQVSAGSAVTVMKPLNANITPGPPKLTPKPGEKLEISQTLNSVKVEQTQGNANIPEAENNAVKQMVVCSQRDAVRLKEGLNSVDGSAEKKKISDEKQNENNAHDNLLQNSRVPPSAEKSVCVKTEKTSILAGTCTASQVTSSEASVCESKSSLNEGTNDDKPTLVLKDSEPCESRACDDKLTLMESKVDADKVTSTTSSKCEKNEAKGNICVSEQAALKKTSVRENNVTPEETSVRENNVTPEETSVRENNVTPEETSVRENNVTPEETSAADKSAQENEHLTESLLENWISSSQSGDLCVSATDSQTTSKIPSEESKVEDDNSAVNSKTLLETSQKKTEVSPGKSQYLEGLSKTIESCKAKLGIDMDSLEELEDQEDLSSEDEDDSDSEDGSDSEDEPTEKVNQGDGDEKSDPNCSIETPETEKTLAEVLPLNESSTGAEQADGQDVQKQTADSVTDLVKVNKCTQGKSAETVSSKFVASSQENTSKMDTAPDSNSLLHSDLAKSEKPITVATKRALSEESKTEVKDSNSNISQKCESESAAKKAKTEISCKNQKSVHPESADELSDTCGLIMEVDTDTDTNNLVIDWDENDVVLTQTKAGAKKNPPIISLDSSPEVQTLTKGSQGTDTPNSKQLSQMQNILDVTSKSGAMLTPCTTVVSTAVQPANPLRGLSGLVTKIPNVNVPVSTITTTVSQPLSVLSSVVAPVFSPPVMATSSSSDNTMTSVQLPTAIATPHTAVLTVKAADGSNQLLKILPVGNKPRHIAPAVTPRMSLNTQTIPSNAVLLSVPQQLVRSPPSKTHQGQITVQRNVVNAPVQTVPVRQVISNIDVTSVNKLNLDKYTDKIAQAVRASVDEIYTDLTSKNNYQTGLKHIQLEIEQIEWKNKKEIGEMRHNIELTLTEMRKGFATEKQVLKEQLQKKFEEEKQKAIDETKKKQWCANCGKEAIFYCCWNTSYCDYPCQTAHWPQHMESCTQSQSPEQSAAANNQSNPTNTKSSEMVKALSSPDCPLIVNKEDSKSRAAQRSDWIRENISVNLLLQEEHKELGRRGLISVSTNGTPHLINSTNQSIQGMPSSSPMLHLGGSPQGQFSQGVRQPQGDRPIMQVGQVMHGPLRQLVQPVQSTMGLTEQMLRGNPAGQLQTAGQLQNAGQLQTGGQMQNTGQLQTAGRQMIQGAAGQILQTDGSGLQLQYIPQTGQPSHPQIGFPITGQQGIAVLQQRPLVQQNNSMIYPIVNQSGQGQVIHRGPIMFSKNQQRQPGTMDAQNPFQIQNRPF